jgi:hypothetical protein
MLFIKNLTDEPNSNFGICMRTENDDCGVTLILPNDEEVDILKSSVPGLATSIRHSIENVGKVTNTLYKVDNAASTALAEKPTEIAAYVKGEKIALVCETKDGNPTVPINVNLVEENAEDGDKPKRYPRDMIVLICPKDEGDENIYVRVDGRNLAGKPVIVSTDDYQIALIMVKWPIWSNLKFPVYMYIEQGEKIYGGIQLGSRTENKVVKNQIVEVDAQTAKDYLDESERILNEKSEKGTSARRSEESRDEDHHQKHGKGNFNAKNGNGRGGNNNGYSRGNGNPSVKFPSKYRNDNTSNKGGSGKNFRRNGQR